MKPRTVVLLTSILGSLPYILLAGAGIVWLWERGWSLEWLALAAVSTISARYLYGVLYPRNRESSSQASEVASNPLWTPAGQRAWGEVLKISNDPGLTAEMLGRPEALAGLLDRILKIVAKEFFPRSSRPELEVTLPHTLLVIELAARDLKLLLKTKVPGSHLMTLHDLKRIQSVSQWAPVLSLLYRTVMFAANPVSGIVREISSQAQGELLEDSRLDLQRWLMRVAVQKAGFYAIELYSGHLELRDFEPGQLGSPRTNREAEEAERASVVARQEPLRILVLGQVKSGKSSLINRLFDDPVAADDVIPRTRSITPYVLKAVGRETRSGAARSGEVTGEDAEWSAVILDSVGYAEGISDAEVLRELTEEVKRSDLLLWVVSAVAPAREPDRRLLKDLRESIARDPHREFPPMLAIVTHVDQLRPVREWDPPYDLRDESREKSRNIRQVLEIVAGDLQVGVDQVVPACLKADETYNVEEGILPGMLAQLPEARRLQCQRCLREHYDSEKWRKLWSQTREAGRVLWDLLRSAGDDRPR